MHILRFISVNRLSQAIDASPLPKAGADYGWVRAALQITFGIAGALAVLFIALGAFSYVTSRGEPDKAAKAKDTIMYAVIGLVVSLAAYGIVAFVIKKV